MVRFFRRLLKASSKVAGRLMVLKKSSFVGQVGKDLAGFKGLQGAF